MFDAKPYSQVWECPSTGALAAAKNFLAQHSVRYLLVQFVDVHGGIKSKCVPVNCLEDLTTAGAGFAGAAVAGFSLTPKCPEYMVVGELETLVLLPWMPGYAVIRGRGLVNGECYPLDTRNMLLAQTERLKARGWRLMTGLEPEFYLLKRAENGEITPFDSTDTMAKPTYDYQGITRNSEFLEALHESLDKTGLRVYQIDHEDANGQFEINFDYDEALKTADNMQFLKMSAKEIANSLGAICSFLPKLSAQTTGNGMHVHCSMVDEQGVNLFHDDSDRHGMGLSELAYQFLAGILAHSKALTALLCPSVNSYKRLVSGTPDKPSWAPVYIAYGDNNRSAMVRIPYGRIEIRIGDSSMNTYLATAAIIAAGMDGVEKKLAPCQPCDQNLFDLNSSDLEALGVEQLPNNLQAALDELEADSLFEDVFGKEFISTYLALKRNEWAEYHNHVSDWEVQRYLEFY